MKFLVLFLALTTSFLASAAEETEVIEFPTEDLAVETVLPVFDKVSVVKNRKVPLTNRLELGLGGGFALTEALYDNKAVNINASYHFDETNSINFIGISQFDGLSSTGTKLARGGTEAGLLPGQKFDASLAPHPKSYLLLNYQMNAYYGKVSVSKQSVLHLSLSGLAGVGMVNFGDSNSVALNLGLGQKIFFTPNWGLRLDLMLLAFNGPDPTSAPANNSSQLTTGQLDKALLFQTFFNVGVIFLL